jgi:tetratricopeptide (TPR) repeat protein
VKHCIPVFCCLISLAPTGALPCTIISGKAKDGVVWAGNNEDYYFDFDTYLNVLAAEGEQLGAVSFTYGAPENFVQGGVNERGLFFDFNALPPIPRSQLKDWGERLEFPGGEDKLIVHILRTSSSVHDAIELIKKYEIDLASAQMHFADREGNLAIVNASGIRLSEADHQISTNFNVFTRGPHSGGRVCWRYPVAQRMFEEQEIGFETIRTILDATQQPRLFGTIYSNVVNLETGDVYIYYAGDFAHALHFEIRDLLRKGSKSYLFRSLFADAPITRIWETYRVKGADDAVASFRELSGGMSQERRAETLRHLFSSCLLRLNRFRDAKIFFQEWLKLTQGHDQATNLYNALIQLANGDYESSRVLLKEQIKIDAIHELAQAAYSPLVRDLLARLEGSAPPNANAHFELDGFQNAKFVGLFLVDEAPVLNFFLKTPQGWYGDFSLPPGRNHYAFVVDGDMILDPSNPESAVIDTEDGRIELNIREVQ